MLFSGLHGKSVSGISMNVFTESYQSARHFPLQLIRNCKKSSTGASETHRHSKSLTAAHAGRKLQGSCRFKQSQRQKVSSQNCYYVFGIQLFYFVTELVDYTFVVRRLEVCSTILFTVFEVEIFDVINYNFTV